MEESKEILKMIKNIENFNSKQCVISQNQNIINENMIECVKRLDLKINAIMKSLDIIRQEQMWQSFYFQYLAKNKKEVKNKKHLLLLEKQINEVIKKSNKELGEIIKKMQNKEDKNE